MAIWPFGRKNKRHTIQVSPDDADALQASFLEPTLVRKSSRRSSKRRSNRLSHSNEGSSSPRLLSRSASQRRVSSLDQRSSQIEPAHVDTEPRLRRPHSTAESLFRNQPQNGPKKLRRRISKRKAHEIMREREIKALSSTPIDIPYGFDHPRRRGNGRRDQSDYSLSNRDSVASSLSDSSDNYTFKVNAFAQLTPRPVVQYVEVPRAPAARSITNLPAGRTNKQRASQEDLYHSRRRMNELADSLDASSLRELMERDHRRREKQQLFEQEKLRRKLQDRADAQQAAEERRAAEEARNAEVEQQHEVQHEATLPIEEDVIMEREEEHVEQNAEEPSALPTEAPRDHSKDIDGTEKLDESARVIGNIDDSSFRAPRLNTQPSFAPSQDMATSRTTLSPSHSSIHHGLSSPTHSQTFGVGSASSLSERRNSDTSGRRANGNTITSLFRRGSSRLKRRYRERFQESSPEPSSQTPSHESFCRIQTQSSPPTTATIIPPRTFVPTGTLKRSRSKFTEHFGDEPLSPPDSRLQSPDIPEEITESMEQEEPGSFLHEPTPSASVEIVNPGNGRHQSWTESFDVESDNVPLSQSLASIDSEGSWMSGQFFRNMNKPTSHPRPTASAAPGDGPADTRDENRYSIDSHATGSNVLGDTEMEIDETWHQEVGRRPVVVSPTSRPKSNHAMAKRAPSLSPICAEEDIASGEDESVLEDEAPTVHHRVASMHGIIDHV